MTWFKYCIILRLGISAFIIEESYNSFKLVLELGLDLPHDEPDLYLFTAALVFPATRLRADCFFYFFLNFTSHGIARSVIQYTVSNLHHCRPVQGLQGHLHPVLYLAPLLLGLGHGKWEQSRYDNHHNYHPEDHHYLL